MPEFRSGNLIIRAMDDKIALSLADETRKCATVDHRELPLVLEFLTSFLSSQSNRRTGFRIELQQLKQRICDRFQVFVEVDGLRVATTPVDLSLTGICVESDEIVAKQGTRAKITLVWEDREILLPGIVIRQNYSCTRTAFQFIGVVKEGKTKPPPDLNFIFRELETLWLNDSLSLEWLERESVTNDSAIAATHNG